MAHPPFPPEQPPDSDERLIALLLRLGAGEEEARRAVAERRGGDLALELNLRTAAPLTVEEVLATTGMTREAFLRFTHALGLPVPADGVAAVPADVVASIPVVSEAINSWLGEDTALGVARVVGSTASRVAETLVDAFRVDFEVPELTSGTSYADVVEQYVDITRAGLPGFLDFHAAVVKAHLVRVSGAAWAPDEANQATRRDLFVAFVDLVGYTALSRTLSPGELSVLLGRFEDCVNEVVSEHGGRLVKLIGDGALFVADDPAAGAAIALELSVRLGGSDTLPPARVGADCGVVLNRSGDYFGDVVNLAARLVALANPGTVVVSENVKSALDDKSFDVEQLPAQALKGFHAPAVIYRLLPR